jgi:putative aminopeptidase FrvX
VIAGSTAVRWLTRLTAIPTAPGRERQVEDWVRAWSARQGIIARADEAGNLILTTGHRSRRRPVVAVAHMDHPALVIDELDGRRAFATLRGGVAAEYLPGAPVDLVTAAGAVAGRVEDYDAPRATVSWRGRAGLQPGDIARWRFPASRLGPAGDRLRAHACDDLAGVAAALSALAGARRRGWGHLRVLLTRAEEVGFVGAIAAARLGSIPAEARVLSIECSRSSPHAPLGAGAIVRVGDAASVFSPGLTNLVTDTIRLAGLPHQRRLMDGGACEATAFAALGYEATGLCLALGNYHNMGGRGRLAPEEISLSDYRGLIRLLEAVGSGLDRAAPDLSSRLGRLYEQERWVLDR